MKDYHLGPYVNGIINTNIHDLNEMLSSVSDEIPIFPLEAALIMSLSAEFTPAAPGAPADISKSEFVNVLSNCNGVHKVVSFDQELYEVMSVRVSVTVVWLFAKFNERTDWHIKYKNIGRCLRNDDVNELIESIERETSLDATDLRNKLAAPNSLAACSQDVTTIEGFGYMCQSLQKMRILKQLPPSSLHGPLSRDLNQLIYKQKTDGVLYVFRAFIGNFHPYMLHLFSKATLPSDESMETEYALHAALWPILKWLENIQSASLIQKRDEACRDCFTLLPLRLVDGYWQMVMGTIGRYLKQRAVIGKADVDYWAQFGRILDNARIDLN